MLKLMKNLELEIPDYVEEEDPTKILRRNANKLIDWTIPKKNINDIKKLYDIHCKNFKKRKADVIEIKEEKHPKFENEIKTEYKIEKISLNEEVIVID